MSCDCTAVPDNIAHVAEPKMPCIPDMLMQAQCVPAILAAAHVRRFSTNSVEVERGKIQRGVEHSMGKGWPSFTNPNMPTIWTLPCHEKNYIHRQFIALSSAPEPEVTFDKS